MGEDVCMTPCILVIEDDPDLRSLIRHTLAGEDRDVQLAADGQEGLALYRELRPDLVLLDVMMPRLSGFEVLQELRAGGELRPECPILILTARTAEKDVVGAFDLGASDYLAKPFMIAELRARVRALLRRPR